jgi:predicted amidophosphoribosyltransferase
MQVNYRPLYWRRHFYKMGLTDSPLCRRCGAQEVTSNHVLCECEALATLRHTYLGSCFLDPEEVKQLSAGKFGTLLK